MKDSRLFSFAGRIFGLILASLCVGFLWAIPSSFAATYIVDSAADEQDGECVEDTTFPEAINCANANVGSDIINFSIETVNLVGNPPAITEAVDLDGNGTVSLSATADVTWAVTASGAASNVTIRGLTIMGFSQCGISIVAGNITIGGTDTTDRNVIYSSESASGICIRGSNNTVINNYIGIQADGVTPGPLAIGISIDGEGTGNIIGGDAANERNIISGNTDYGIRFWEGNGGATVSGNYIGLNALGTTAVPNGTGIYFTNDSHSSAIQIGGTTAGERNIISGNTGNGISIAGVDPDTKIIGNYIGTNVDGTAAIANGQAGIAVVDGTGSVIGYGYSETIASEKRNLIRFNTTAQISVDGAGLGDNITIRGNDLGTTNPTTFVNSPNNGVVLTGTSVTTSTTSRFAITTDFADGSKVDVYSVSVSTGAVTYEGTATVSSGAAQLDMDFTAVAGDNYFYQITEADGDSTVVSGNSLVVADSSAPSTPTVTSSTSPTNVAAYTFTGTKDANSGVWYGGTERVAVDANTTWTYAVTLLEGANAFSFTSKDYSSNESTATAVSITLDTTAPSAPTVTSSTSATNVAAYTFTGTKDANSGVWYGGTERVAVDANTTWTYAVTLLEGANAFSFTSKDYSSNESTATAVSITLDTTAPSAPTVTSATSYSDTGSTYSATITGTKEAGFSVKNNGTEIVAADGLTTWSYASTLAVGSNTYSFVVTDAVGNPSSATAHTITYTQLSTETNSGMVGGGSGSGYQSNHYSDTLIEEEEEEGGEIVNVEEDISSEEEEMVNVEEETIKELDPAEQSGDQFEHEVGIGESLDQIDASDFVEQVEVLYPVSDVSDSQPVFLGQIQPQEVVLPETAVTREDVFAQPILEEKINLIEPDNDRDVVPDWWEKANFNTLFVNETADSDNDGVTDQLEWMNGTNPVSADSDSDGVSDGTEIASGFNPNSWDSDKDGLSDVREIELGTDPLVADSDEDGIMDNIEVNAGSNPLNVENTPVSTLLGGVPDQWLKDYGLDNVLYGQPVFIEELNVNVERTLSWDTDKDGLSDRDELTYGTNPLEVDSDDDGVSDGAEVYVYQTDPNLMTRSEQLFQTRISSLRGQTRNIYMDGRPVIAGTSKPDTQVQISFILLKGNSVASGVQESLLKRLSHLFLASLFEEIENTGDTMTLKTQTGGHGKFLVRPEDELPVGRYAVVVRSFDADGNITSETLPYDLTVDPTSTMSLVNPKQLDDHLIDVANLEIFKIQNSQPYLYGVAEKGYEVVTSWESELFTSFLVVDTTKGEFLTASPSELEQGDHNVFVYAVQPEKNLYSSVINVGFQVVGASNLYSSAEEGSHGFTVVAFGVGGVLLMIGLGFVEYKKKHSANVE